MIIFQRSAKKLLPRLPNWNENIQGSTFAALLTHLSAERFILPLDRSYCNDLPSGIHRICTAPLEQILLPCCSNRYDKGTLPLGTRVHRSLNTSHNRKRLVRTVLIFTESSDQLSRATDRVPGLPASPGYVQ